MTTESAGTMRIEVVYATADMYWQASLTLTAGATVAEALAMISGRPGFDDWFGHRAGLAVFGRAVGDGTPLRDGDRVELLRPLQADPKQARRLRAGR